MFNEIANFDGDYRISLFNQLLKEYNEPNKNKLFSKRSKKENKKLEKLHLSDIPAKIFPL